MMVLVFWLAWLWLCLVLSLQLVIALKCLTGTGISLLSCGDLYYIKDCIYFFSMCSYFLGCLNDQFLLYIIMYYILYNMNIINARCFVRILYVV